MASANEKRAAVAAKYKEILGRNKYSQEKRNYCFKKYSDGKYYSDCSSSVSYCYKEAGYGFGILNTVGMYQNGKFTQVPVTIENGIIQNPEILRQGDMLLFAGNSSGRKYAGYVGHVEMLYAIDGARITLCGHGSGTPSTKEMNEYCRKRYNTKSSTALGNKGLIKVVRYIQDDEAPAETENATRRKVTCTGGSVNIRTGPGTEYTAIHVANKNEKFETPDTQGWIPIIWGGHVYWGSSRYFKEDAGDGRTD